MLEFLQAEHTCAEPRGKSDRSTGGRTESYLGGWPPFWPLLLGGDKQLCVGASPDSVAQQGSLCDSAFGILPATAIDVGYGHLKALDWPPEDSSSPVRAEDETTGRAGVWLGSGWWLLRPQGLSPWRVWAASRHSHRGAALPLATASPQGAV